MELPLRLAGLRAQKVFYGWWMVAAGVAASMVYGGLYTYGFSTYFRPLTEEFGWTRTALSGVISLARLEGGIVGPVVGFVIDRVGPRKSMISGLLVMASGLVLMSMVQDFLTFALVYLVFLSVGSSLGTISPITTALANWFVRKRTLALGLFYGGFGFGGVMVPVTAWTIAEFGWRNAAVISAAVLLLTCIPLALVMRHRPEQYGTFPDGIDPAMEEATRTTGSAPKVEVNFTPREALRTPAFWLIALAWMMWSTLPAVTTVHLIPYFTDIGFGPQLAATLFGAYAFVGGISRPIMGWVGDKVNKRYLLSVLWFIQVAGLFLLAQVNTVFDVIVFMLVFAPTYGGTIPLRGALQADYFGRRHYATIAGFLRALDLVGTVSGPVAVGWAFDNFGGVGGYRTAFMIIGAMNLLGALAVLLAKPPAAPGRPAPVA
jgi:sugar phosphate permease